MDAAEFVSSLEGLAPSHDTLSQCGYSEDEANAFLNTFKCRRRSEELAITTYDDPMLELIRGWDIASVEIGSLGFLAEPLDSPDSLIVGRLEADPLAFRKNRSGWVLLDRDDERRVMCEVAESGEALLRGLLSVAGLYARTSINLLDFDDEEAMQHIKADCLAKLGGARYDAFCTSILGV